MTLLSPCRPIKQRAERQATPMLPRKSPHPMPQHRASLFILSRSAASNPGNPITCINCEIDPVRTKIHSHAHIWPDHPNRTQQQHTLQRGGILPDQIGVLAGMTSILGQRSNRRQTRPGGLRTGRQQQDHRGDAFEHIRSLPHLPRLLQGFPRQIACAWARFAGNLCATIKGAPNAYPCRRRPCRRQTA